MSIKINENVLKRYKSKAETFFRDSQSFAGDGKDNIKELFRSSKISAIELRNAFESYILKNYDKVSGVEKSVMEEYLKVFYITFLKEPDKHLDSLLLQSSDVVSKLCPDLKKVMGDKKVSLKDTVKSTYLTKTKNWKELYTRDKNTDSLSQEEINILMHKMKSLIGSEKKEDIQMVTDYVKKMLSQYKPTNDLEDSQLEFLAKYISNRVQNDRLKQAGRQDLKEDIFIYVGTEKPNLGGYSIGDEIYLNKQSTLTENLAKFFQTVSHETEHWVQKQFAYYDDKTKAGLDAAMTDVIRDYYRKHHSEFDVYNENYRFEEIEEDAERVGSERAEYYLRDLGFEDKAQSVRSTHKNKTKARRFEYNVRRDENGNWQLLCGETVLPVQNGEVGVTAELSLELVKAAENTSLRHDLSAEWADFRGTQYQNGQLVQGVNALTNNGITTVPVPVSADDSVLYWANKLGDGFDANAVGSPILVGDYLITYSGSTIFKIDTISGAVVKTGKMHHESSFSITPPTYYDGMIFVALADGYVQAFDAETLESLWIYKDKKGGQPNSPITVRDGYLYTGFCAIGDTAP